jgi:hypothetical protein
MSPTIDAKLDAIEVEPHTNCCPTSLNAFQSLVSSAYKWSPVTWRAIPVGPHVEIACKALKTNFEGNMGTQLLAGFH